MVSEYNGCLYGMILYICIPKDFDHDFACLPVGSE